MVETSTRPRALPLDVEKRSLINSGTAVSPSGSDGNVFATAVAKRQVGLAQ
jgi:hypothetical protein